jgi:chromosome segregation ATPase
VATVEQLQISYSSDVAQKATADKTALDGLAAGAEKAGKGIDTVDTAIKRANATFESSNRLVDGAAAAATRLESANQKLQDRIRTVNQEVATGNLTVEAAAAKIQRLTVIRDQDAAKAEEYGKKIEQRFAPAVAVD